MADDGADGCNWEIRAEELQILSQIGEGSTATVYMGEVHGRPVAVKEILMMQGEEGSSIIQAVQRELRVLSRVKHPNILRFFGLVEKCMPLRIVLEYCAGGSVFELVHNHWDIPLSRTQRIKILLDTASATDYLHGFDPPILHRDLKSLNLMLLEQVADQYTTPHVKLADFGFSRVQERAMTQGVGTKHWMAPEVLSGTDYTDKADVFSFAMIVFEVVCRQVPFERLDPTSVARLTKAGKRPNLQDASIVPEDASPELIQLIKECWDQNPTARPSFADIVNKLQIAQANIPKD